jgi:selenocysteine lyase/cysteine desulfurase
MERAGVVGSLRAGRLRLSFHINNGNDDADRAVEALQGFVFE